MSDPASPDPPHSTENLIPQVYEELRQLATLRLRHEKPGQTISGTALVHEVFLKFTKDGDDSRWANRSEFFSTAAEAMRRILIDRVRAKNSQKRGGEYQRTDLDEGELCAEASDDELLAIHEALDELEKVDPEGADLVKLRFFVGFTLEELAEENGVAVRTISRKWAYAKAWLKSYLSEDSP